MPACFDVNTKGESVSGVLAHLLRKQVKVPRLERGAFGDFEVPAAALGVYNVFIPMGWNQVMVHKGGA